MNINQSFTRSSFTSFIYFVGVLFVTTACSFAQSLAPSHSSGVQEINRLTQVAASVTGLVNTLITIVVALAFVYFFYNLAVVIRDAGGKEKTEEAKEKTKWGIIAIFVLVSIWGIIFFLQIVFLGSEPNDVPTVKVPSVELTSGFVRQLDIPKPTPRPTRPQIQGASADREPPTRPQPLGGGTQGTLQLRENSGTVTNQNVTPAVGGGTQGTQQFRENSGN